MENRNLGVNFIILKGNIYKSGSVSFEEASLLHEELCSYSRASTINNPDLEFTLLLVLQGLTPFFSTR
ncbi:hypothetical protein CHS0354_032424 [Potamilus streckersoni]|uniref:Uncharacterized protein n=1 Tax=Potamilus streckersoni TaxID=2493646 RepID=A0AAE0SQ10_9BIVA|nr:hypothetical protein CHS0354_032424 [Potamilus streckersoni]